MHDCGLVRLSTKPSAVLAVPYLLRFLVQLPLFLAGQGAWLGFATVVLGWPLGAATLLVMGLVLSRGRTPLQPEPAGVVVAQQ